MSVNDELQKADLCVTRTFDAPRDLVWSVWTDPKHAAKWWGPKDFTNPVYESDVRVGGEVRNHMRSPDGTIYPCTAVYTEVVEPERLAMRFQVQHGEDGAFDVDTVVTFDAHGEKTTVTVRQNYFNVSTGAEDAIGGASIGWNQSLDKLRDLLAQLQNEGNP